MAYQQLQRYGIRQFQVCTRLIKQSRPISTLRPQTTMQNVSNLRRYCAHTERKSQFLPVDQDFSVELCAGVAALLNKGGVGNLLVGTHLLSVFTVPTLVWELSYAVPCSQLDVAIVAIEQGGLMLCRDKGCSINFPRNPSSKTYRNPHAHFHLNIPGQRLFEHSDVLQLYTVEDVAWELAEFTHDIDYTDGPGNNIIFANDAALPVGTELQGVGRLPLSIQGVRIPTLHRYVEALILLALRSGPDSILTWTSMSEVGYLVNLVDMERLNNPIIRQICECLLKGERNFWGLMKQARELLAEQLRKDTHWDDVQVVRATWK